MAAKCGNTAKSAVAWVAALLLAALLLAGGAAPAHAAESDAASQPTPAAVAAEADAAEPDGTTPAPSTDQKAADASERPTDAGSADASNFPDETETASATGNGSAKAGGAATESPSATAKAAEPDDKTVRSRAGEQAPARDAQASSGQDGSGQDGSGDSRNAREQDAPTWDDSYWNPSTWDDSVWLAGKRTFAKENGVWTFTWKLKDESGIVRYVTWNAVFTPLCLIGELNAAKAADGDVGKTAADEGREAAGTAADEGDDEDGAPDDSDASGADDPKRTPPAQPVQPADATDRDPRADDAKAAADDGGRAAPKHRAADKPAPAPLGTALPVSLSNAPIWQHAAEARANTQQATYSPCIEAAEQAPAAICDSSRRLFGTHTPGSPAAPAAQAVSVQRDSCSEPTSEQAAILHPSAEQPSFGGASRAHDAAAFNSPHLVRGTLSCRAP